MLLPIHIAAGGLAIVLGAVALSVRKGGSIHRRFGLFFVYAMAVMGISAAILGVRKGETANVFAGIVVVYFVGTALTTVRAASSWTRVINVVALTLITGVALLYILAGVEAFNSPHGVRNGVPYQMLFFLSGIMILAALGDVRVLRSGLPRGRPRLARHLWRMCFALFIATGSFFSIRQRVARIFPDALNVWPIRLVLIVLPFAAMFYWLWRIRRRRALTVVVRNEPIPPDGESAEALAKA